MSTKGTERALAKADPVAWWCWRCETAHWSGMPTDGCTDCGYVEEVRP